MTDEDRDSIWIITEPTPDGTGYMATVHFNEDRAVTLTPEQAVAYATDVLTVVGRAEYDAAVMRQITKLTGEPANGVQMIKDLRDDRPTLTATAPLVMEPSVAVDDGNVFRPFIALHMEGKQFGQWTMDDARGHAVGLLEVCAVADMDAAYARSLVSLIGLDKERALAVVGDLARYR